MKKIIINNISTLTEASAMFLAWKTIQVKEKSHLYKNVTGDIIVELTRSTDETDTYTVKDRIEKKGKK